MFPLALILGLAFWFWDYESRVKGITGVIVASVIVSIGSNILSISSNVSDSATM
jgi:uncharacterized membrane protein YvlD (DUF360 family)